METDEDGSLSLDLQPGTYRLTATRVGFFDFVNEIDVKPSSESSEIHDSAGTGAQRPHRRSRCAAAKIRCASPSLPTTSEFPTSPPISRPCRAPRSRFTILTPTPTKPIPASASPIFSRASERRSAKTFAAPHSPSASSPPAQINYHAVFALAEIDPAFHPGEIIVADTLNGHPLRADSGPFRLIVSEDKRQSRCVRNLVSIELKSID